MKAIIVATLLVLAAQASLLDTTDYTLGFDTQLGLDTSDIVTGLQCFQSLNVTIESLVELFQDLRYSPSSAILTGINLITTVNGDLKTQCEQYFVDLVTLIAQNSGIDVSDTEEVKEVVEQNAKFYLPQLVQQVAAFADNLLAQNSYQAGATEAYIVQILLGLVKPAQVKQPTFNFNQYVPFDVQKYIAEFSQAYYTKLGADPQASQAYVQCYNSIQQGVPAIEGFIQNFRNADSLVEKVEVVQNSSDDIMQVIESCLPAIQYHLELFVPVFEAVEEHPVKAILTILHNVASNAPEIEQIEANQSFDVFTGEYAEAGDEAASIVLTAFAGAGY